MASPTKQRTRHLGDLVLDQPEVGDALSELLAADRVTNGAGQRLLRAADVPGAQLDASEVEDVERDLVAFADRPQHVLDRHLHIVEHQRGSRRPVESELVLVGAVEHAHAAFDDEGGEVLAVDLGEHGEDVGEGAVGDPQLLTAQAVALAVRREGGGGSRREGIRTRFRLGQRKGADQLAVGQPRQVPLRAARRCRSRRSAACRCWCGRRANPRTRDSD